MSETNYKSKFCEKYFDKNAWDLDVLNQVDILLKDALGKYLLYIESKYQILNETEHQKALAQIILTNKKQKQILSYVALIFQDENDNDILELIDCSDDSVMFNNDFNWQAERPSSPGKDAIYRIYDRIQNKITRFENKEIKEFYLHFKKGQTQIQITEKNFNLVYNQWKNELKFVEEVKNEQDSINLFLMDMLNGTMYTEETGENFLQNTQKMSFHLIREGTNLSSYKLRRFENEIEFKYSGKYKSNVYTFESKEKYDFFWKKYKRPPHKEQFKMILEKSATLYSDKYRKDTGGEYTPTCFVEKQSEILNAHYHLNEFIVFDPCAGVGNLENQFGKEYKDSCYLSTLEQMDVDICKIKGFENVKRFDYLKNDDEPKFKYAGNYFNILEICKKTNKKLMVIMNPPYQNKKGMKNNTAIEFFNKVLKLEPEVIVFYYMTESFLRDEIEHYIRSGYKIVSHIFSNAQDTFQLSQWSISQIVFDKNKGEKINKKAIPAERYEYDPQSAKFNFFRKYTYNYSRPNLIQSIQHKIKENEMGMRLGNYSYLSSTINLTNKTEQKSHLITTQNLKWCLLSKGINFNTHHKYFERNQHVYRGEVEDITDELFNDSIAFSLFFKNCAFTNKGKENYIMPFTAQQLGCAKNDLNILFPSQDDIIKKETHFDFREFLEEFQFSKEAQNLFSAGLEIFRFYHRSKEYKNKNWNDSFYDISNAIMGKDNQSFKNFETENDTRIAKTKTGKGTRGFGKNTIHYTVEKKYCFLFEDFFNARDILAKKINQQLIHANLLLWERENIY